MSDFKISMRLTKAFERVDEEGVVKRFIGGLASGTNLDLEGERMAESAILAFKKAIDEGMFLPNGKWSLIPLRSGHREEWDDILGHIVKAEVDSFWNLYIEAELDPTNPVAMGLFEKLTRPEEEGKPLQLGLSVGGFVVSAGEEWDEERQRFVRVYHEVRLTEVSVVSRPANPITYVFAMAKSVDWSKVKGRTVLVSESDMEEEILTKDADAEATEEVVKSEEVVAAEAVVVEEAEVVERSESVEEGAVEEQVEKTDASVEEGADIEDEVVKSVEVEAVAEGEGEVAEVSKGTDPLAELKEQMAELTKSIALISEVVAGLTKSTETESVAEEVEKAADAAEQVAETDAPAEEVVKEIEVETETAVEVVEKAASVDIAEIVKAAVAEVIKSQVAPLMERIETLESEPVDKSIAVRKADEMDVDPLAVLKSEADTLGSKDVLRRSLQLAGARN